MINRYLMAAMVGAVGSFAVLFMFLVYVAYNSVMTYCEFEATLRKYLNKNTLSKAVTWATQ